MKIQDFEPCKKQENFSTMQFWISAILLVIWFLAYMIFDAGKEIHFVFLLAVLVVVEKIVSEYKDRK